MLPAYLNALAGNGVHIVTVNDYLAKRDSDGPRTASSLQVGVILATMTPDERRVAYVIATSPWLAPITSLGSTTCADNMAHSLMIWCSAGTITPLSTRSIPSWIDEARTR